MSSFVVATQLVDVILCAEDDASVTAWMEENTILRSALSYRHPEDGSPALVAACRRRMVNTATRLLDVDVSVQDTNFVGDTALHWACLWSSEEPGMLDVVERLLIAGADPSAVGDVGNTPLHLAATANNLMVRSCQTVLSREHTGTSAASRA
jgi:ankyrin repeat protein